MSAGSGRILVTFGAIADAQADTASTYASLNQQLADLKSYLAPLVATWHGQASEQYNGYQRQWDTAAADLNSVLNTISSALGVSNDNYQQAESTNAAAWG